MGRVHEAGERELSEGHFMGIWCPHVGEHCASLSPLEDGAGRSATSEVLSIPESPHLGTHWILLLLCSF